MAGRAAPAWDGAGSGLVVAILALMMFLAPALGVPNEEMLQDTLKSIVVSFAALGAALVFFWQQRERREPLRWHAVVWLPLLLMAYALGSMAWSHTYLGGVEAVRWFIFALLLWLGANNLSRDNLSMLAWGIHAGAVVASLWAALQFWVDFRFFPAGPAPGLHLRQPQLLRRVRRLHAAVLGACCWRAPGKARRSRCWPSPPRS